MKTLYSSLTFIVALLYFENTVGQTVLKPRDETEIKYQARKQLTAYSRLLNLLSDSTLMSSETERIIKNSFLPHPSNQLFYDDEAIIEDDIDPNHKDYQRVKDSRIEPYLSNFSLYYSAANAKITFSNVITNEITNQSYVSISLSFTSFFGGKNKRIKGLYVPTQRIATFRAEKENNKWRVLMVQISFQKPSKVELQITEKTIPKELNAPVVYYFQTDTHNEVALKQEAGQIEVVKDGTNFSLPTDIYISVSKNEFEKEGWRIEILSDESLKIINLKNTNWMVYRKKDLIETSITKNDTIPKKVVIAEVKDIPTIITPIIDSKIIKAKTHSKFSIVKILPLFIALGASSYAFFLKNDFDQKISYVNLLSTSLDPNNTGYFTNTGRLSEWKPAYDAAKEAQSKQNILNASIGIAVVASIVQIIIIARPKPQAKGISIVPSSKSVGLSIVYKF